MFRYFMSMIIAAGFLSAYSAGADDKPQLSVTGWGKISDPDDDCTIGLKNNSMTLAMPGTPHDFAAELERWNAPRIMSKVRGDFVVEVKISGAFNPVKPSTIEGRTPYNGAGILIVQDEKNYLSLQRAALFADGHIRHYLNFELRKDGDCTVSDYQMGLKDKDTYLRVERLGKKVYGMASQDGVHWRSYDPIEVDFPPSISVGVVAVNSSADGFNCAFEDLNLFRKVAQKTEEDHTDLGRDDEQSENTAVPSNDQKAQRPVGHAPVPNFRTESGRPIDTTRPSDSTKPSASDHKE